MSFVFGARPLQAGDGLGGPLGDHGHQGQDDPRPDHQGGVGLHQEEGAAPSQDLIQKGRHVSA